MSKVKLTMPKSVIVAVGASAVLFTSALLAAPRLQTGPDTEITHDGLHRVDKTAMDMAWVKPDLDLTAYDRMMLGGAGMAFTTVDSDGRRYWPGRSNETEFPIDEDGRARLQEIFHEIFLDELSENENYELVNDPGPGTLLLVGSLIDVVSHVPPQDQCVGRCEIYLTEVGEATLIVELRDSVTNEILARAVDRRAADTGGWATEMNSVTAWSEVRQLARTWSRLIRRRLDDFQTIDDLR
jgi:hypothetical protein